jgi:hypothetical protein
MGGKLANDPVGIVQFTFELVNLRDVVTFTADDVLAAPRADGLMTDAVEPASLHLAHAVLNGSNDFFFEFRINGLRHIHEHSLWYFIPQCYLIDYPFLLAILSRGCVQYIGSVTLLHLLRPRPQDHCLQTSSHPRRSGRGTHRRRVPHHRPDPGTARQLILEDFDALQDAAKDERRDLDKRRTELIAQRQKLLDAHYARAIPLDLLKTEQDRIAVELVHIQHQLAQADGNYEQARTTLAETLDLTRDCYAAYLEADDNVRRLFNQAFFTRIYIDEDDLTRERTVRVDYNQPFDELLSRLIPARAHHDLQQGSADTTKNARQDSPAGDNPSPLGIDEGQGSHTDTLVEIRGLKPRTSALPALRSNQLSYIPIVKKVHSLVLFCIKLKKPSLKKSKIKVKTLPCQPRH